MISGGSGGWGRGDGTAEGGSCPPLPPVIDKDVLLSTEAVGLAENLATLERHPQNFDIERLVAAEPANWRHFISVFKYFEGHLTASSLGGVLR